MRSMQKAIFNKLFRRTRKTTLGTRSVGPYLFRESTIRRRTRLSFSGHKNGAATAFQGKISTNRYLLLQSAPGTLAIFVRLPIHRFSVQTAMGRLQRLFSQTVQELQARPL